MECQILPGAVEEAEQGSGQSSGEAAGQGRSNLCHILSTYGIDV